MAETLAQMRALQQKLVGILQAEYFCDDVEPPGDARRRLREVTEGALLVERRVGVAVEQRTDRGALRAVFGERGVSELGKGGASIGLHRAVVQGLATHELEGASAALDSLALALPPLAGWGSFKPETNGMRLVPNKSY